MAKRKNIDITGSETVANPDGAPSLVSSELPSVELPPLSPATETAPTSAPAAIETPAPEPTAEAAPFVEPITAAAPATSSRFVLRRRHKRYALLAASMTFAAALGAIVGALASGGFSAPVKSDPAAVEESKAMQQSIARLGKEVTTLKASLDAANKSARTQIAKITDRLEHAQAEITGSISAPQTAAPLPVPLPAPRSRCHRASTVRSHGHCAGLDHPRYPRRLCLCGKSRRSLSSLARGAATRPRPGRIGQAAGRPLGGDDAEGHHRVDARPALFRRILSARPSGIKRAARRRAACHLGARPVARPPKSCQIPLSLSGPMSWLVVG